MIDTVQKRLALDLTRMKPGKAVRLAYEHCDIEAPAATSSTTQPLLDLAREYNCYVAFNDYYRRCEFRLKAGA